MNGFDEKMKTIKKLIELETKIQELFSEVNEYTKSHKTLEKENQNTQSKILEYYDNKEFILDNVYEISRGTDKEDELFDYANIPSYMKSNKNTYNKKDKDDCNLSR